MTPTAPSSVPSSPALSAALSAAVSPAPTRPGPDRSRLPVVVIGAGPIGLAAAAHLLERGLEPVVLERGPSAGSAVRSWGHVRLFSAWSELVDPAARRVLEPTGWVHPDANEYPLGRDWVERYLEPLAAVLGERIRYNATVIGASRRGRDVMVDSGRADQPLTVHMQRADGSRERMAARGLVDASGTYRSPSPLGSDGYPAAGEAAHAERISHRIPDLTQDQERGLYAGQLTAVVGSGHSALTALVALAELAREAPGTRAVWVLRRGAVGNTFGGGEADQLPARGALGLRAKAAIAAGDIDVIRGFRTAEVQTHDGRLVLVADDGRRLEGIDRVVGLTGFRPDHTITSELRLNLDPRLGAPVKLAPLIDPNIHSCGTVYPHGAAELAHEEQDVFVVGMKSYGRAPTFLAMTGYEQVRSVAAALAGDLESAARVELTLPETGVCGGAGLFDSAESSAESQAAGSGGCCGGPGVLQIGTGIPVAVASSC
ncbi:MAG TPA: FAD-dependent oxidoreductase [Dermatophilaceae bacterium]|nr:FAD-dependent oxidoreductase [Dermatophilaceae bacterium]